MDVILAVITIISLISAVYFMVLDIIEYGYLKKKISEILGYEKIKTKEDLVKLKTFLNKYIKYNPDLRAVKRPLLRHTASHILKTNYGFCGENARVAIKMMLIGGMKASRIYLYGTKWGHVVTEQQINKKWYLFDGHYDPKTVLSNDKIATIESQDLSSYPNDYSENHYVDFCRIKLFYKISGLKVFSKLRLPSTIIYIFESPNLIKSVFSCVIFVAVIVYYFHY
jgi:Transglutaminase-like domain